MNHKVLSSFLLLISLIAAPLHAFQPSLQVSAGAGGSYPYDGAKVSGSPAVKARVFYQPWRFFRFGASLSQQLNYVAEPQVTGSPASVATPPSYGIQASPHFNNDTNVTNNQTNNNTQNNITNNYPPAPTPVPAARLADTRLSSTLSLEPEIQLGWCFCEKAFPYLSLSYTGDRHSLQDSSTVYGNGYSYGAGVDFYVGQRWFINVEVKNKASESSVAVFRTVQAGLNAGMRFNLP